MFVYLARDAPIGVVLRRGPTNWVRLSLWHTDTDRIEHGQWMKGRVYERRSDVSPDGRLFAAFVRQTGGREREGGGADTWLALSEPPLFTARAVWFIGGTYYTGGWFPNASTLWLGFMEPCAPDRGSMPSGLTLAAPQAVPYVDGTPEWTDRTVHFNRLLRDGWTPVPGEPHASAWEHRHPRHDTRLTMCQRFDGFGRVGGPYAVDYGVTAADGATQTIGPAAWADWDQQGRLAVARAGHLGIWRDGNLQVIEDFNGQVPDPRPADAYRAG